MFAIVIPAESIGRVKGTVRKASDATLAADGTVRPASPTARGLSIVPVGATARKYQTRAQYQSPNAGTLAPTSRTSTFYGSDAVAVIRSAGAPEAADALAGWFAEPTRDEPTADERTAWAAAVAAVRSALPVGLIVDSATADADAML